MRDRNIINVWDPLLRIFHWALVLFFVISYATGDEESVIHPWSGYAIVALLLFRVFWGFTGPKHARFADFIYSPKEMLAYGKGLLSGNAKRYLGHNPLGGLMVVVLLASVSLTGVTGMMLYGAEEGKGPLAGLMAGQTEGVMPQLISTARADEDEEDGKSGTGKQGKESEFLEETHEFFANFTVLLVLIHLVGVFVESSFHKESLVRAMFDGKKRART
jgi:cytochrome b